MASDIVRVRLKKGADPEAVQARTGVKLTEEGKNINAYNCNKKYRLLQADPDVEVVIEGEEPVDFAAVGTAKVISITKGKKKKKEGGGDNAE